MAKKISGILAKPNAHAKPGSGGRFAALQGKIEAQGKSPAAAAAIAASAGRKKYGSGQMAKWAAAGRK